MENEFANFEYFISHFAAEDIINKHVQAFKQRLIDFSYPEKVNLSEPKGLEFAVRELFMASMMANLQILAEYHRWLLVILEQQMKQSTNEAQNSPKRGANDLPGMNGRFPE